VGEPAFERRVKNGAKFGGWGMGGWQVELGREVGLGSVVEWIEAFGSLGSSDGRASAGMGVVVSGWVGGRRDDGGREGEDDAGSLG